MIKTAYIGIGSNLGDKPGNCRAALAAMDRLTGCRVTALSAFYRTEPVGVEGQDWYLNAVAALEVEMPADWLLRALSGIETAMGRVRRGRWDARPIDLDILLYADEIIDTPELKVPHPLLHTRRFVMVPLAALAPQLEHPQLGMTMQALLDALPEAGQSVTVFAGE